MSTGLAILFLALAALLSTGSALLAAVDAAYAVSSRTDLEQLAEAKPLKQHLILAISEDRPSHMNATNFTRVVAEAFAAVLISLAFVAIFENLWLALLAAAAVTAFVSFVLVGASPRTLGAQYPDFIISATARWVRFLRVCLGPVATALIRMGTRVSPGKAATPGRLRDEQQLLSMVDQAAEQELLQEDEQGLIHSVVDFSDTMLREVMVPRTEMVTVDSTATINDVIEVLLHSRYSRIPVTSGDSDEVIGVVYLRDVSSFAHRRPEEVGTANVTRVMKPAQFVPELQRAGALLREMQRNSNHLALVVDEYGGIAGLVTLEDLIEELIGDISDEYDREIEEVIDLGGGRFEVLGRLGIEELGELFDRELEDEDVDTVSGLIAKHLGRLATEGDTVVVEGIELTVLKTHRKRQRLVSARAAWVGQESVDSGAVARIKDPEATTTGTTDDEESDAQ